MMKIIASITLTTIVATLGGLFIYGLIAATFAALHGDAAALGAFITAGVVCGLSALFYVVAWALTVILRQGD